MAKFTILECLEGRETRQAYNANGVPWRFETGDLAAAKAGELTTALGRKHRASQVPDKEWRDREMRRLCNGTYKQLPDWLPSIAYDSEHYPHLAATGEPGMVAYTQSAEQGELDRQTRVTARKYLGMIADARGRQRYLDEWLARWDEEFSIAPLVMSLATTPDEIEAAYTTGKPPEGRQHSPVSCMSYPADEYRTGGVHPVRVYGAGDLAVAYLKRSATRITARALCWPENKVYGRIYGDASRLRPLLEADGYSPGDFEGARLLRLPRNGAFIAPYLDGNSNVTDEGEFLVIAEDGEICCNNTNGISCEAVDGRCECEGCGERFDEDDIGYVECLGGSYCNECEASQTFCCEGTSEQHAISRRVTLHDGTEWCREYFADNGATCADTGEKHATDDMVELENGSYLCQDSFDELGFTCDETGENHLKTGGVQVAGDNGQDVWICLSAFHTKFPDIGNAPELDAPLPTPVRYTARLTDRDRRRLASEGQLNFKDWLCQLSWTVYDSRELYAASQSFFIPSNGQ